MKEIIFNILTLLFTQILAILIAIGLGIAFKLDSSFIHSLSLTSFCFASMLFNILLSLQKNAVD